MPGYAERFKTIHFPELGDDLWVTIRNPKTMPPSALKTPDIVMGPDGMPVDEDKAEAEMYKLIASLVKSWRLYDATSDDDDQPVLPLPATAELVAKLPVAVFNKIVTEMSLATNPT